MADIPPYIQDIMRTKPDVYVFTQHAIDRYIERNKMLGNVTPRKPERTLQRLIRNAEVEDVNPTHKAVRLINNNYRDAIYLVSNGWRFVVSDDNKTVITVERVDPAQN